MEKSLVEKNLDKLKAIQEAKQSEISKVKNQKTKSIGRAVIGLSDEEIEANVEMVAKPFDDAIGALEAKTDSSVREGQKKAIQDYYAAEIQPTPDQIRSAEDLVEDFNSKKSFSGEKEAEFMKQLQFHLENETAKAAAYVLANKMLFPKDPNQEAYALKLNPLLDEKMKAITLSNVDSNLFELYRIEQMAKTNGSLSMIERVSLKNRAFELGGNGNLLEFK